jgi:hypothetical protein
MFSLFSKRNIPETEQSKTGVVGNNDSSLSNEKYIVQKDDSLLPQPIDGPIVYFLIQSHGKIYYKLLIDTFTTKEFEKYPYKQYIHKKNITTDRDGEEEIRIYGEKPKLVDVPDKIKLFNKITYAPYGLINVCAPKDDKIILNNFIDRMPSLYEHNKRFGNNIIDELTNIWSPDYAESALSEKGDPDKIRVSLHLLKRNKKQIYQSFVYDENDKKPIFEKIFSEDKNRNTFKIYVVFQEGGNLTVGEQILSEKFEPYLYEDENSDDPEEEGLSITTGCLLKLAADYGYSNVVMIDYSCEVCSGIPRDKVMQLREECRLGNVRRGGIAKHKITKTRKIRRTRRTRKISTMYKRRKIHSKSKNKNKNKNRQSNH